ncbi:hypothetical protein BTVI_40772 [Pitangus sulphuratus]|nr:hypothetical protein BTVI_40772 [Pitangus sulphuratus]
MRGGEDIVLSHTRCFQVIRLGATPVSLSFLSVQVYAASSEKTSKKELLKIEELSLYSSPARETKYVENPQTELEEGVSRLRRAMEPYTAWCQVAGTQLYDWSLQGYIAVESLWKDTPKKKKSGEKSDKVISVPSYKFQATSKASFITESILALQACWGGRCGFLLDLPGCGISKQHLDGLAAGWVSPTAEWF